VKCSEGYKAASAKADGIIKAMNLKLKDCIIDVSMLTIADLREQLLKSIVGSLLLIGEGLYISQTGVESYYKHRIFVDLMESYGDFVANTVKLAKFTTEELVKGYQAHHRLREMPSKSVAIAIGNRYAVPADPSRLAGTIHERDDSATEPTPLGTQADDGASAMDTGEEAGAPARPTLTPDVIGNDKGYLTMAREALINRLARAVEELFSRPWAVYSLEEDKLQRSRALRKMHLGTIQSDNADEITAILDLEGNVNLQTLNALIDKKVNDGIRASKQEGKRTATVATKKDARGQDGAAGPKKTVQNPPHSKSSAKTSLENQPSKKSKHSKGKGKGDAAAGGRGNDSSDAARGRGGDRSSNGSGGRGRGNSKGRGRSTGRSAR
jgi:hypothetical protein